MPHLLAYQSSIPSAGMAKADHYLGLLASALAWVQSRYTGYGLGLTNSSKPRPMSLRFGRGTDASDVLVLIEGDEASSMTAAPRNRKQLLSMAPHLAGGLLPNPKRRRPPWGCGPSARAAQRERPFQRSRRLRQTRVSTRRSFEKLARFATSFPAGQEL